MTRPRTGDSSWRTRSAADARSPRHQRPDGNVRFPPVIVTTTCHAGTRDRGPGTLLRSGQEQGLTLRRRVLLRRDLDGYLLPAQLSGPHPQAPEHAVLPDGRGRTAGGLPGVSAVPTRRNARLAGVEHPRRRRRARHATHPRRHRRPRRRRRAGRPPELQHAPTEPPHHGRSRHGAARPRPGPAQSDGACPARDDRPPDRARRVRRRLRQRASVQRHHPRDLRRHAERAAGPGGQVNPAEARPPASRAAGHPPSSPVPTAL